MNVNLDQDVANLTAQLTAKSGVEGIKITGKLAKELLNCILEVIKENTKNRTGVMSLKKLVKSNEELQVLKLDKRHLEEFEKRAKDHRIGYAVLNHEEDAEVKIFLKSSQIEIVKSVMEDILKLEKLRKAEMEEKISEKKALESLDKLDFKEVGEEYSLYRHKVENLNVEKIKYIKQNLEAQNIKSDVSIEEYSKEFNTNPDELIATLQFKVAVPQKDKAVKIIDALKDKSLEELKELSKKLAETNKENKSIVDIIQDKKDELNNYTENAIKNITSSIDDKKSIDDVINSAKIESQKYNNKEKSQSKSKEKTQQDER
ncbi:DUF3801 domain-containing protein [Clostridium botulinum]|uniref:Uncharacterized protein n=1 Tax=Clostridium botulinum TaxID=1491 RepID=A0A0A0UTX5_CLOBO|nr:DUF3801 domain-containing protein [Clostridium botulinum]AIW54609.1 hypothetical protein [Clostridium botulinum]AIW54728.1 hypothetical protein [Clostridium botulinum]AIW54858.1 hypothetical protein [Clostridium botulinum]MBY7009326.1 DUF3801 domain-containing protein [Clostridium botulinum]NFH74447.1 DUF3801 domain-containing protein [Clostridium botulinum]